MENYELKSEEIERLWSQIVSQMGITRFSHTEWENVYKDFWKCMLPESKSFIQIQSLEKLIEPFDLQSLGRQRKNRQLNILSRKAIKQNSNVNFKRKPNDEVGVQDFHKLNNHQYDERKENVPLKKLRCLLKRSIINNTEQADGSSMQSHKLFIPSAEKHHECDHLAEFSNITVKKEDVDVATIDSWLENSNEKTPSENDFEIDNDFEFIDFLVGKNPLNIEITFENRIEHDQSKCEVK